MQGPAALWNNPAGLWMSQGSQIQTGTLLGGDQLHPWLLAGAALDDHNSAALGYRRDYSSGSPVEEMSLGISVRPVHFFSLGVAAFMQTHKNGLSLDLSGGVQYRLTDALLLGADLEGFAESLEQTKLVPDPNRKYGGGLAWFLDSAKNFLLTYDASFDNAGAVPRNHSAGVGVSMGKIDNIRLLADLSWDRKKTLAKTQVSGGLRLQEKFFHSLVRFQYSIQGFDFSGGNTPLHSVELGIVLDPFRDIEAPSVSINLNRSLLLLSDSTGENKQVYFRLKALDSQSPMESWHLVIYSTNTMLHPDQPVRSFHGKGVPPRFIRWEGLDSAREVLSPGIYTYRLIVTDKSGNPNKTSWQLVEVR